MATFEVGEIIGNQVGGTPTTLFVTVNTDATTPILYQWLRNGIAIPGAVDATYNFIILPEDSYATYTVFVQNPCGQETSLPSTVGVVSPSVFCKQYECDAYQTAIFALSPIYLTMTTEAAGAQVVDVSGNNRNNINKTAVQGPYLANAGVNPCTEDNYVVSNDTVPFNIRSTTAGRDNDPVWYDALDDITYHTVLEYQNEPIGTLNLIDTYTGDSDSPNESPTQSIGISRLANGDVRIGFSNFYFGVGGYYTQFLDPIPALQKPVGQPFPFGIHLKRNVAAVSPWETYVEIYVDHQLVQTATLTIMASPYSVNDRAKLASWGTGWSTGGAVWNGANVHLAQNWAKAGSLSTEQLATLAGAWERNDATYVDPDPNCTQPLCKQYQCDALQTAILTTNPDSYWPMNVQADLDNYPTSDTIPDYSAYGQDLTDTTAGVPQQQPSNLTDFCSGNATGVLGTGTIKGNTPYTMPDMQAGLSFFTNVNPLGSGFSYFLTNITCTGPVSNGRSGAYFRYISNDTIEVQVYTTNQLNQSSQPSVVNVDFSTWDANWKAGIIGFVLYNVDFPNQVYMDVYYNFEFKETRIMPKEAGQTDSYLESNAPVTELNQLDANGGAEEMVWYQRPLTSNEIATLRGGWLQNQVGYVDPNPNCTPVS